jgi:ABC-type polysaccharide/polyol phosphate transport system ATPase subunit
MTEVVLDWCSRVMWLDQGRIRDDGPAAEVLARYMGHPAPAATAP